MKCGSCKCDHVGLADVPTGSLISSGASAIGSLIPIPGAGMILGQIGGLVASLIGGKPSGDPAFVTFNFQNGIPVFAYLHNEEGKTNSDTNTQAMGMVALLQKLISLVQMRGGIFSPPQSSFVFEFSAPYPTRLCWRPAGSTTKCTWQDIGNPGDATGGVSAIWDALKQYANVYTDDLDLSTLSSVAGSQPPASYPTEPQQAGSAYPAMPAAPQGAYPGATGAVPSPAISPVISPWLLLGGGLLLAALALA